MYSIKNIKELIKTILYALILLSILQVFIQNYQVEGPSMEPNLTETERIFVNRLIYHRVDLDNLSKYLPFFESSGYKKIIKKPNRGDIIVFRYPNNPKKMFVKRVIGISGDEIKIVDGYVYLNGGKLPELYLSNSYSGANIAPKVIGKDLFFVLGDNRAESNDSRNGWLVPYENIQGKAWILYWPLNKLSII